MESCAYRLGYLDIRFEAMDCTDFLPRESMLLSTFKASDSKFRLCSTVRHLRLLVLNSVFSFVKSAQLFKKHGARSAMGLKPPL